MSDIIIPRRIRPSKNLNNHWEISTGITCIELNHGRFALIDTVDYPKVSQFHWGAHGNNNTFYARSNQNVGCKKTQEMLMHVLILNPPPGMVIDHIDGNGLNNSSIFGESNIRIVTCRENLQNRHDNKLSRFAGVTWHKHKRKWTSQLRVGSDLVHLGGFDDETEAAKRYQMACAMLAEKPTTTPDQIRERFPTNRARRPHLRRHVLPDEFINIKTLSPLNTGAILVPR